MKPLTQNEVTSLRHQGKTFQEIADMYGCSRQYVHQLVNKPPKRKNKVKAPTKAELYAQVEALTKENIKLQEMLEAEERKRWERKKDKAVIALYNLIPFTMFEVRNLMLDHIDKSGYWFTFYVEGYTARQTYCVRHTDLTYKEVN